MIWAMTKDHFLTLKQHFLPVQLARVETASTSVLVSNVFFFYEIRSSLWLLIYQYHQCQGQKTGDNIFLGEKKSAVHFIPLFTLFSLLLSQCYHAECLFFFFYPFCIHTFEAHFSQLFISLNVPFLALFNINDVIFYKYYFLPQGGNDSTFFPIMSFRFNPNIISVSHS